MNGNCKPSPPEIREITVKECAACNDAIRMQGFLDKLILCDSCRKVKPLMV